MASKLFSFILILALASPALARDGDKTISGGGGGGKNTSKNELEAQLDAEYQAAMDAIATFDATCGCDRTQVGWSADLSQEQQDSWAGAYEQYENYAVEVNGAKIDKRIHKDYESKPFPLP